MVQGLWVGKAGSMNNPKPTQLLLDFVTEEWQLTADIARKASITPQRAQSLLFSVGSRELQSKIIRKGQGFSRGRYAWRKVS